MCLEGNCGWWWLGGRIIWVKWRHIGRRWSSPRPTTTTKKSPLLSVFLCNWRFLQEIKGDWSMKEGKRGERWTWFGQLWLWRTMERVKEPMGPAGNRRRTNLCGTTNHEYDCTATAIGLGWGEAGAWVKGCVISTDGPEPGGCEGRGTLTPARQKRL